MRATFPQRSAGDADPLCWIEHTGTPNVMHAEPILIETIAGIQNVLGADLNHTVVERAVIGLLFTGVKLSTGVAGAWQTDACRPGPNR
jgi:hypothetical protein